MTALGISTGKTLYFVNTSKQSTCSIMYGAPITIFQSMQEFGITEVYFVFILCLLSKVVFTSYFDKLIALMLKYGGRLRTNMFLKV